VTIGITYLPNFGDFSIGVVPTTPMVIGNAWTALLDAAASFPVGLAFQSHHGPA
jgi:hypothetical protein